MSDITRYDPNAPTEVDYKRENEELRAEVSRLGGELKKAQGPVLAYYVKGPKDQNAWLFITACERIAKECAEDKGVTAIPLVAAPAHEESER